MKRTALAAVAALAVLWSGAPVARAAPPAIGSIVATEVASESVLLEANLQPNGLSTTYSFEYTPLAAFSEAGFAGAAASAPAAAGTGTELVEVGAAISGLMPDTVYYFRLTAVNSSGAAVSQASTFTTSHGPELACEGDACQALPSAPADPTLTTLLIGLGNPSPRYHRLNRHRHKAPKQKPQTKRKHHKARRGSHR
jgi:hypothetical protein